MIKIKICQGKDGSREKGAKRERESERASERAVVADPTRNYPFSFWVCSMFRDLWALRILRSPAI